MLDGDRLALARLITRVENRSPEVPEIMRAVHERTGRAYVLGITGPPGAGKSTLVDRITSRLRAESLPVGIIAVDPSSPFTGGAVLGDRIRMQTHTLDPDVFIRSMATRGSLGGLARATGDVIKLMDAFGFPWIIIETVGRGPTDVGIGAGHEGGPDGGRGRVRGQQGRPRRGARADGRAALQRAPALHERRSAQGPRLGGAGAGGPGRQRRGDRRADGPDPPAPGRARAGGRPGRATAGAAARGARGPAGGGVHHPAHRARADRSRALRHHRGGDRRTARPLLGGEPDPGRGAQAVLTARAFDTPA